MNLEKQFQDIKAFNDISGNLDKPVNPQLEYDMLKEELDEYFKAAEAGDNVEVIDAICDLQVVLYGTMLKHGLEEVFSEKLQEVCDSNMSKFCDTIEEAIRSVQQYEASGVHVYYEFNDKYNKYVIKRVDKKVLKGINFFKPKL